MFAITNHSLVVACALLRGVRSSLDSFVIPDINGSIHVFRFFKCLTIIIFKSILLRF